MIFPEFFCQSKHLPTSVFADKFVCRKFFCRKIFAEKFFADLSFCLATFFADLAINYKNEYSSVIFIQKLPLILSICHFLWKCFVKFVSKVFVKFFVNFFVNFSVKLLRIRFAMFFQILPKITAKDNIKVRNTVFQIPLNWYIFWKAKRNNYGLITVFLYFLIELKETLI